MISGFFDPERLPHPYVNVAVNVPFVSGPSWVGVRFLLDTGAGHTCVHPLDAVRRFGVQPATLMDSTKWPALVNGGGVGGGARYFDCSATYAFPNDDGTFELITGTVWFGELTPANQQIPSLLGWDLLQHFKLEIDGAARTVMLQRISGSQAPTP